MKEENLLPDLGSGNTIIFGCIVGSHAYGTNVEGSDVDKKWIYVQSAEDLFINGYKPFIELNKDETAYELSRFIELAKKANPTILELLYTPEDCVLYRHPAAINLFYNKHLFLTKECRLSFGGYAVSQIEKAQGLDKKMNWEKENTDRKSVLDFCYWISNKVNSKMGAKFQSHPIKDHFTWNEIKQMGLSNIPHTKDLYNLFWDARMNFKGIVQDEEKSNDISLSDVPQDANCIGTLYFNKDAYTIHCKKYKEYQEWLQNRNTQRYIDIENHGQKIDGKNMLHCTRLINTALDIAEKRELIVRRPEAPYLKGIRQGKFDLATILNSAKDKIKQMDEAFKNSSLPEKFNSDNIIKIINTDIRSKLHNKPKYY